MSSYVGKHAELYDLFYADKDYVGEAAFVHECLQQHAQTRPGDLLEIACGTGRHSFELEKLGYRILATDYSEDMLRCARDNAARLGSSVEFLQQDMRALDLKGRTFDAAVCLFDSIGYVRTNDAIRRVLDGVWRHLRQDGLFLLEFWHAPAMLRNYDPVRTRSWRTAQGEIVRVSRTTLDIEQQTADVAYTIYDLRQDGSYARLDETQTNRYFLIQEMALHLALNGFNPLTWFAGFSGTNPIAEDTWHIVALARKVPRTGGIDLKGT